MLHHRPLPLCIRLHRCLSFCSTPYSSISPPASAPFLPSAYGPLKVLFLFFFFSSRRRHTRLQGDWSSECALPISKRAVDAGIVVVAAAGNLGRAADGAPQYGAIGSPGNAPWVLTVGASSTNGTVLRQDDTMRSEERRVGKESRGRASREHAARASG